MALAMIGLPLKGGLRLVHVLFDLCGFHIADRMALVTPFKMLRAELIPPVSGVPELGAPNRSS